MTDRELLDKATKATERGNHKTSAALSLLVIARNLSWLADNADRLAGRGD